MKKSYIYFKERFIILKFDFLSDVIIIFLSDVIIIKHHYSNMMMLSFFRQIIFNLIFYKCSIPEYDFLCC